MKIIQIIDSLEAGGAERMAVNYANALSNTIEFSGIVVTRKEGILKQEINCKVEYLFLNKNKTIDIKAIFTLYNYCKKNKINIIHAHTSSFFIACFVKIIYFKVKIIWHDHYGLSDFLDDRKSKFLKIASVLFFGIITVNENLKDWAIKKLLCKNVINLPNFTSIIDNEQKVTFLKGFNDKRILCLANLRVQKNHHLLLSVAKKVVVIHPEWSFHIVGKDFNDNYSNEIKTKIKDLNLIENVFFYNSKKDIQNIISQSEICILTSQSEGLPISLLEYGLLKKAVVVTNVGEISSIVINDKNGFIVNKDDENSFFNSLLILIENEIKRKEFGNSLFEKIIKNHSEKKLIENYIHWITKKNNA